MGSECCHNGGGGGSGEWIVLVVNSVLQGPACGDKWGGGRGERDEH